MKKVKTHLEVFYKTPNTNSSYNWYVMAKQEYSKIKWIIFIAKLTHRCVQPNSILKCSIYKVYTLNTNMMKLKCKDYSFDKETF